VFLFEESLVILGTCIHVQIFTLVLESCLVLEQHVYIPVLFIAGVDYIDAPTPYLMGLHSSIDIAYLTLDGVSFCVESF
jgi:hypothetical protein